jgi:hypothetical protein
MTNSPEALDSLSDTDIFLINTAFVAVPVLLAFLAGIAISKRYPGDVSPEAYTILPEPKKSGWQNWFGSDA